MKEIPKNSFLKFEEEASSSAFETFTTGEGKVVRLEDFVESPQQYAALMDESALEIRRVFDEEIAALHAKAENAEFRLTGHLPREVFTSLIEDSGDNVETAEERFRAMWSAEGCKIPSGEFIVAVTEITSRIVYGTGKLYRKTEGFGRERVTVPGVVLNVSRKVRIIASVVFRPKHAPKKSAVKGEWFFSLTGRDAEKYDTWVQAAATGKTPIGVTNAPRPGGFDSLTIVPLTFDEANET